MKKGLTRKFHFNLVAATARSATSESYTTKESAIKGTDAVRPAAADAVLDDHTT